jgi:hypothetical protein
MRVKVKAAKEIYQWKNNKYFHRVNFGTQHTNKDKATENSQSIKAGLWNRPDPKLFACADPDP